MALKKINGTPDNDILIGKNIAELIRGFDGNDKLYGNGGADRLEGGDGKDILDGGSGGDVMLGGLQNDTYYVDQAGDKLTELKDQGTDTVISEVDFVLGANFEKLQLSGNEMLSGTGNMLNNTLTGNDEANVLDGLAGADKMVGKDGDDTYHFDSLSDKAVEAGADGTDSVIASVSVALSANIENLTLTGSDDLSGTGNDENNAITGNGGSNTLDGGKGVDQMTGGGGDDHYVVDNTGDKVIEIAGGGTDEVTATASFSLDAEVENLTLAGSSAINGHGNSVANVITGNGANNKLYADDIVGDDVGGNDELHGGAGNDTLYSGDGSNTLDGGEGTGDTANYSQFSSKIDVNFSFGSQVLKDGGAVDVPTNIEGVRGGSGDDNFSVSFNGSFYGGVGADVMSDSIDGDHVFSNLFGESGNDTLRASGNDGGKLDGGADNDALVVSSMGTGRISMTGGSGADEFWLLVNKDGSGGPLADGTMAASVMITDFVDGTDKLVFEAWGSVDTAQEWFNLLSSANEITEETDGLHISADAGPRETVIKGLTLATFSADDISVVL